MTVFNAIPRWILLACVASSGVGISWHLYQTRLVTERASAHAQFYEEARIQGMRAATLIGNAQQTLDAFDAFFSASDDIKRVEFNLFAGYMLGSNDEIEAIYWAPYISRKERQAFEHDLDASGIAHYGVFDIKTPQIVRVPAPPRDYYLPIYFAAPTQQQQHAIGIDLQGREKNILLRQYAASTGKRVTTPMYQDLLDPTGPASVAVYQPLYCHNQNFAIPCDNALQLRGFLVMVLRPEILFQKRLDEKHGAHLSMRLIDLDDGHNVISPRHIPSARPEPDTDVYRFPIMMPERHWELELRPNHVKAPNYIAEELLLALLALTAVIVLSLERGLTYVQRLKQANVDLELQKHRLAKLASHDSLTGLPNRRKLQDKAEWALSIEERHGRRTAICMLDLDNFKQVNDQLGHRVGDLLLQQVAYRLLRIIRKGDIVSRIGGDEFVLLFPLLREQDELLPLLQRLLTSIQDCADVITQGQIPVTASLGIAISNAENRNFKKLLHQADQAMYQAKQIGKNNFAFWQE